MYYTYCDLNLNKKIKKNMNNAVKCCPTLKNRQNYIFIPLEVKTEDSMITQSNEWQILHSV